MLHSPDTWRVKVMVSSRVWQMYFPECSGPAAGMAKHRRAPSSSRMRPLLASTLTPALTQWTGAFPWESTQARVTVSPVEAFRTEGVLRGCTIITGGSGRRGQVAQVWRGHRQHNCCCWAKPQTFMGERIPLQQENLVFWEETGEALEILGIHLFYR